MTRRRRQRDTASFSLSFLDAISCGFGALVILLVLTKVGEPKAIEEARVDLDGRVRQLEAELVEIRGETTVLERLLETREEQLSEESAAVARLRGDLSELRADFAATEQMSEIQEDISGRLLAARQSLTEEMKRLQERRARQPVENALVGGIPVDSEYIVFVIDTSGSMQGNAWPLMLQKMQQVLDIYPKVKGIQVMNDMGQYLFPTFAGRWIPDSESRRRAILTKLAAWKIFSNSSPVEGIERAIRNHAREDQKMSIYVFGDELSSRSIEDVLQRVDRMNPRCRGEADGAHPRGRVPGHLLVTRGR